jgi:hypothetical protein
LVETTLAIVGTENFVTRIGEVVFEKFSKSPVFFDY